MKSTLAKLLLAALLASATINLYAQGTAFTYQGQLNSGATPVSGIYDLTFALFNASSGGAGLAGPVTNAAVPVTNGLFTVLVDFGSGVFTGSSNWLSIGVRTNGGGAFTPLNPRQQLTPTPYAVFAETANAAGLSGTIPVAGLGGTYSGPLALTNSGNSFVGNGAGLYNVNASQLGGLAASNFWQTTGNAGMTAGLNFLGTTDNQPLELDAYGSRGLHLEYTSRSSGYPLFSYQAGVNVIGGYWGNTISNTVIGGVVAGGGDQAGSLFFQPTPYPNTVNGDFGAVGGGYSNTAGNLGTVPGGYNNTATGYDSFAAGANASATSAHAFVWSDGTSLASSSTNSFDIAAAGGVHINGTDLFLQPGNNRNEGIGYRSTFAGIGVYGPVIYSYLGGALGAVLPDTVALKWDASGDIWVSNNLSTATLTIRGGADLAEPFNISAEKGEVSQGAVVVIDAKHPGHLKLSDRAYDKRVAGVISGANGINPGIQMHQEGLVEGGKNVALTGRVYVQADASNGAIEPGDMLTTSAIPGHAMKVSDHAQAAGAILGKAMTGLSAGKGMVLVLVTLQ